MTHLDHALFRCCLKFKGKPLKSCPTHSNVMTTVTVTSSRQSLISPSVPAGLPELLALTAGRSPEECVTVVERIYSCHHPSLSPDNKHALEVCVCVRGVCVCVTYIHYTVFSVTELLRSGADLLLSFGEGVYEKWSSDTQQDDQVCTAVCVVCVRT